MNLENPLENQKDEYLILKEDFLSGKKSLKEVRDFLLQKDQETADRKGSIKNLEFLKDRDIVNYFLEKAEHREKDAYYRFLSFTEFHVAQIELMKEENEKGVEYLKEAIASQELIHSKDEDGEKWKMYLNATLLYLENKKIPEEIILQTGKNAHILEGFNKGLEERGFSYYRQDYGK